MHFEFLLAIKQLVMLKVQYFRPLNMRLISHGLFGKEMQMVIKHVFKPVTENCKLILASFFMNSGRAFSQQIGTCRITIIPVFGKHPLFLQNSVYYGNKSVLKFESLKFYLSSVQLLYKNIVVYAESESFHLVDLSKVNSLHFSLPILSSVEFDEIHFNFGLNNLTSITGAMRSDLYSGNEMYSTAKSGYSNFKLEGISDGKKFQFNLGGYQAPFQTWQKIELNAQNRENIEVLFDLQQFIESIDVVQLNQVVSPSKEAKELSEKLAKCFYQKIVVPTQNTTI